MSIAPPENRVTDCCDFDYSGLDVCSLSYALAHKDHHVATVLNTPADDLASLDAAIRRRQRESSYCRGR